MPAGWRKARYIENMILWINAIKFAAFKAGPIRLDRLDPEIYQINLLIPQKKFGRNGNQIPLLPIANCFKLLLAKTIFVIIFFRLTMSTVKLTTDVLVCDVTYIS